MDLLGIVLQGAELDALRWGQGEEGMLLLGMLMPNSEAISSTWTNDHGLCCVCIIPRIPVFLPYSAVFWSVAFLLLSSYLIFHDFSCLFVVLPTILLPLIRSFPTIFLPYSCCSLLVRGLLVRNPASYVSSLTLCNETNVRESSCHLLAILLPPVACRLLTNDHVIFIELY